MLETIHQTGKNFNIQAFMQARNLTIKTVSLVHQNVEIGMTEKDGQELINETLIKLGAEKKWHPSKFRIGKNTTKSFKEESNPGEKLKLEDIFFIDIGPVWHGHEGDFGETYIIGKNQEYSNIIRASRTVFEETAKKWREEDLSGAELYQYAKSLAQNRGYELSTLDRGHRLGDSPHHLYYRGKLGDIDEAPINHIWVLEMHLTHPSGQFGAFFEDILIK